MRVIQILPTLGWGDAVGNDTRAIHRILKEEGYDSVIAAEAVDARIPKEEATEIGKLPEIREEDLVIYHASTGSRLNFDIAGYPGRKMMIYHNITPPEFFRRYNRDAGKNMAYGYEGIRYLKDKFEYCIADSEYNRQELRRMGYETPIDVCPILIPFEDYDKAPSKRVMEQYGNDGKKNWLFVGRIAPNKKQEDVIRAFCRYQRDYEPESRLFLVGNAGGMERYETRLKDYIHALGLDGKVIIPGHIPFDETLAYYRLADLFVCMSEHEGFCVPLAEAMHFRVPIIAYGCCAVPDTLGSGGLLLDSKEPELCAAAADRVMRDEKLREAIRQGQEETLERYRYQTVKKRLMDLLKPMLG